MKCRWQRPVSRKCVKLEWIISFTNFLLNLYRAVLKTVLNQVYHHKTNAVYQRILYIRFTLFDSTERKIAVATAFFKRFEKQKIHNQQMQNQLFYLLGNATLWLHDKESVRLICIQALRIY